MYFVTMSNSELFDRKYVHMHTKERETENPTRVPVYPSAQVQTYPGVVKVWRHVPELHTPKLHWFEESQL